MGIHTEHHIQPYTIHAVNVNKGKVSGSTRDTMEVNFYLYPVGNLRGGAALSLTSGARLVHLIDEGG